MFKALLLPLLLIPFCSFKKKAIPHCRFNYEHSKLLKKIPEPSDIVYDSASNHFYIVSDHGTLFECDGEGEIIRKAPEQGVDFEGVEVRDSFIYVSDETPRMVYKYRRSDLSLVRKYQVSWGGGFNKAFESIAYNEAKHCFVLISQTPVVVVEYDDNFKEQNRYPLHIAREVNGARWHNGFLYMVGSLDHTIFKCDPNTYEVKEYYDINVLNAEGLAFDGNGKVFVTSDNLQKLFFFNTLPTPTQLNKHK